VSGSSLNIIQISKADISAAIALIKNSLGTDWKKGANASTIF
jgi:hypothetical protein